QTFWQRYFVNVDHYRRDGPCFLYVVGEQAAQSYMVSDTLATKLAEDHGGAVYALEHRFYGLSQPFSSLRTETLKFLTTELAIKDLIRFAHRINDPFTGSPNPKRRWFLIGGSYGGTLAAWARQSHPDIFHGAFASSAPVIAQEDFPEYDLAISRILGPACANRMAAIVSYVDTIYANGTGFQLIKDMMGCGSLDDIHFLYTFYDSLSLIVQYDTELSDPNVADLCSRIDMPYAASGLHGLMSIILRFYQNEGTNCTQFSNSQDLQRTHIQETSQVRQWTYQCCTEFGFWQSAPKTQMALRSRYLTKEWFNAFFCSSNLYSKPIGPPNTQTLNFRHAGKFINTNRIIFTNGANDPWAQLSITDPTMDAPDNPVILINNASHAADLYYPSNSDPQPIQEAHNIILDTFRRWII
ncbi:hypothetical protein L0F63_003445, partial [Massospora cicadina]